MVAVQFGGDSVAQLVPAVLERGEAFALQLFGDVFEVDADGGQLIQDAAIAGSCPDGDVGVVVACGRWRVHCHIDAAPGWPFSYFSSGRVARELPTGHPTSGPLI